MKIAAIKVEPNSYTNKTTGQVVNTQQLVIYVDNGMRIPMRSAFPGDTSYIRAVLLENQGVNFIPEAAPAK